MEPDPIAMFRQTARCSPLAWGGLIATLGAVYLVARLVAWSGMYVALRPWRLSAAEPWVERARRAWPGRRLARLAPFLIAPGLTFALLRDGKRVDLLPAIATNDLVAAAAVLGVVAASNAWGGRLNPAWPLTPRPARGAWARTLSWIGVLFLLILSEPFVVPERWGAQAWALLAGGTIVVGAYVAWGWRRLMRWSGIIRPAGDRFRTIATRAAERARIELRSIEQAALPMANAFAFVHDRGIAVTDAALAILDDEELGAICAHELAHLGEPGWVRTIRLAYGFLVGLWLSACWLVRPMVRGLDAPTVWLIVLGGPAALMVAGRLFLRLVHRMEVRADAQVGPAEESSGTYARALAKIYETNLVPAVIGAKGRSHPELYDRLVAAGVTPEYPRPAAPPRGARWAGALVLILGTVAGGLAVTDLVARWLPGAVLAPHHAALWTTGAAGGTFYEACALARAASERGDVERELEFYRAAADLDPSRAFGPAMLAGRMAQLGRCSEARRLWAEAIGLDHGFRSRREDRIRAEGAAAIEWARPYVEAACPGHSAVATAPDDEDE